MKARNEKQQQAYDLLQKIPQVVLVDIKVQNARWYDELGLCIINNQLFLRVSDIDMYAVATMRKHLDAGEINKKDMIPVRNRGQRYGSAAIWVASVGTIKSYESELIRLGRNCGIKIDFAYTWIARDDATKLNSYTLTDEQINEAHHYYQERVRLLNENQDDVAAKMRAANKPFEPIESTYIPAVPATPAADDLTLEQLVDRIEAMGWTVTLHRKDGTAAETTDSHLQDTAKTIVPSWYNNDLYQMFGKQLTEFNVSVSTINALEHVGIVSLGQVASMSKVDLLRIKHFGKKKLTELDDLLESLGLEFGQDIDKWHEARKAYLASKQ